MNKKFIKGKQNAKNIDQDESIEAGALTHRSTHSNSEILRAIVQESSQEKQREGVGENNDSNKANIKQQSQPHPQNDDGGYSSEEEENDDDTAIDLPDSKHNNNNDTNNMTPIKNNQQQQRSKNPLRHFPERASHARPQSSRSSGWNSLFPANPVRARAVTPNPYMQQSSRRGSTSSARSAGTKGCPRKDSLSSTKSHVSMTSSIPRVANLSNNNSRSSLQNRRAAAASKEEAEYTFQPKTNSKSKRMASGLGSLMKRMEAGQSSKTRTLETRRGEKEYHARVDKKCCPECGATQTYDEHRNRKNKCQGCNVGYRHSRTWHGVGEGFLKRVQEKEIQRTEQLKTIAQDTQPSFRPFQEKLVIDPRDGTTRRVRTRAPTWNEVNNGFMTRLETDIAKRESRRSLMARIEQDPASHGCTFQPKVYTRDSMRWSVQAEPFLERMKQDLDKRTMHVRQSGSHSRTRTKQVLTNERWATARVRAPGVMRPPVSVESIIG